MYRLLREAGQVRERRAQAAHPARTKPELIATGPNEVWSWDITKLAGPQRGVYYHLYVMIDIFSRCAVHSEVHATELGELAKDFMTEAVRLNGGTAPMAIHADRGTSMTSKPVSALLSDLAILKTHSDERTGRRLARAIQGRGAFRRFKDELHEEHPDLVPAWYAFRDARARRRAVKWLADNSLIDDEAADWFLADHPDPGPP